MQQEWFKTWFDTEFYHILYSNRNEEEANRFIDNLIKCLSPPAGSRVLDVACGKGRHAKYMSALGMNVTGIDLSAHSIACANLSANSNLHFEVWDMREPFHETGFDIVTNLFSSFGYFQDAADDTRAILAMSAVLKPGGYLVMDYMNPEKIIKDMKPREIVERGGIQFHIRKKLVNGFIRKQINFIHKGEEQEYEEQLKVIKYDDFKKIFAGAGLNVENTFGSYDFAPFSFADSMRQIWILKKEA